MKTSESRKGARDVPGTVSRARRPGRGRRRGIAGGGRPRGLHRRVAARRLPRGNGVCPDNAIIKLGDGRYEIDYDYCKGCGLCAAECPCGAIQMQLRAGIGSAPGNGNTLTAAPFCAQVPANPVRGDGAQPADTHIVKRASPQCADIIFTRCERQHHEGQPDRRHGDR